MPERRGCGNYRVSQTICPLENPTLKDCLACEDREIWGKVTEKIHNDPEFRGKVKHALEEMEEKR